MVEEIIAFKNFLRFRPCKIWIMNGFIETPFNKNMGDEKFHNIFKFFLSLFLFIEVIYSFH